MDGVIVALGRICVVSDMNLLFLDRVVMFVDKIVVIGHALIGFVYDVKPFLYFCVLNIVFAGFCEGFYWFSHGCVDV